MSVREGLEFETEIASDSAALNGLVEKILDASKTFMSCAIQHAEE